MSGNHKIHQIPFQYSMILFFIFSLLFFSCGKPNVSSLEGSSWVLTFDPDSPNKPPDDIMEFKKGGKVDLKDSKKVYVSGTYEEKENGIIIKCIVKGQEKTLEMTYSDDKSVLINPAGAQYKKQQKRSD